MSRLTIDDNESIVSNGKNNDISSDDENDVQYNNIYSHSTNYDPYNIDGDDDIINNDNSVKHKSSYDLFNLSSSKKRKHSKKSKKKSIDKISQDDSQSSISNDRSNNLENAIQSTGDDYDNRDKIIENKDDKTIDKTTNDGKIDNKVNKIIPQSNSFLEKFINKCANSTATIMTCEDTYESNDSYIRDFLKSNIDNITKDDSDDSSNDDVKLTDHEIRIMNTRSRADIDVEFGESNNNKQKSVRLFNLPYRATEREIMYFATSRYIKAVSVTIQKDRVTDRPNGSAILYLRSDEIVDEVVSILNRRYMSGREIRVEKERRSERYFDKSLE